MAAASYYGTADTQVEKPQLSPSRGPQATGMHPEGSTLGLSQELHQSGEEQRSFTQQGFNEEVQHGMPQQGSNEQRIQQSSRVQNSGIHGGQQQQQQMDNTNYTQGEGQQMYGTGEPAAVDNRDTITKWLDKIEKKFGGERFNNPQNAEKNRRLNANILRRVKQVGMLVVQRAPRMLMNMAR